MVPEGRQQTAVVETQSLHKEGGVGANRIVDGSGASLSPFLLSSSFCLARSMEQ